MSVSSGNKDSPIPVDDGDEEVKRGEKRKGDDGQDGVRKRRIKEIEPFEPELQQMIDELKTIIPNG